MSYRLDSGKCTDGNFLGVSSKKDRRKEGIQILADHRRIGKRFIPPFLQIGPLHEVSWADCTLPELLWLGLLNDRYGLKKGADLALSLAKTAAEASIKPVRRWYAPTSAYSLLAEQQKAGMVDALRLTGDLSLLKSAFGWFVALYPECPLEFLLEGELPHTEDVQRALSEFKAFLTVFFDKFAVPATLAQANAIYIAFGTDILKVVEGLSLANFPAVSEYPHTEESVRIAASVRAAINAFFGFFLQENCYDKQTQWSRYFWNRGLELEPCMLEGA